MQLYDCRFFHETIAVLFEQRRQIVCILDDMSMRLEELERALGEVMSENGYDYDLNTKFDGQFSKWTQSGTERLIGCNCPECSDDYRMD